MNKLSVSGLIVAAFLVGCATTMVAAPTIVPPARAGTAPVKWEYQCKRIMESPEATAEELNKYGAEGWELAVTAGSQSLRYCLKRQL